MKSRKKAWIPALLFGAAALAVWGITLWGSCVSAPWEGLFTASFQGTASLATVLSLTDFYSVLFRSLFLQAASAAAGCLLGFALSLLAGRLPSRLRAAAGALLLLPLFVPSALWTAAGPLAGASHPLRVLVISGLKAAGLSAFAGCLFRLRGKSFGAFLVPLALLCALLSPDPESALSGGSAGEMVLDAWILARGRDPMAFAASFILLTVQVLAAVPAALALHSLTLSKRPAAAEPPRERSALFPAAVFGTAVLLSCLALLPFLLRGGTLAGTDGVLSPLLRSLSSAGLAVAAAFLAALLVLSACGRAGKGAFALLCAALFALSSFTAAKPLLYSLAGLLPTFVPTALNAAFSREVLVLLLLLTVFSFRNRAAVLFGAAGAALLAACRGVFSLSGVRFYGDTGLASLNLSGDASAGVLVLTLCLVCYILSALCFSRLLTWEVPMGTPVRAGQVQGLKPSAVPAPRVTGVPDPDAARRPLFEPPEAPALDEPQVPASSAYSEQFAQNNAWMPPRAPAQTLPLEEAEAEEPAPLSSPEVRAAGEADLPPGPAEPSLPEGPSPAQVVSLINALTKMRSMGIVTDQEYREKRDRLMKLL